MHNFYAAVVDLVRQKFIQNLSNLMIAWEKVSVIMPHMRIRYIRPFLSIVLILPLSGCASVADPLKMIWGSSTKALQEARADSISKTYPCHFDECFDAVLKIAGEEKYKVFMKDRVKGLIDVIGVKGNVNTTEVGIFLDELNADQTKIDIASLSTTAKTKVARAVFDGLDKKFGDRK